MIMCGFSTAMLNFKLSSLFFREFELADKIVRMSLISQLSVVSLFDSLCMSGTLVDTLVSVVGCVGT